MRRTRICTGMGGLGSSLPRIPSTSFGDALGSVRQLVDDSGMVTLSKSYQPYGQVMDSTGSGVSSYGYTGEMQAGDLV